jgi:uncharacterized membrane protein YraQ (UPF0718 family)
VRILEDRVLRGGIAGVIGQVVVDVWINLSFYVLHFSKARWVDAISSVLWGHMARTAMEWVAATFALLVIGGMVGGAFAWLVLPRPGAGNYVGRAIGTGLTFWIAATSIGTFFRIPNYTYVLWQTTFTRISAMFLWGAVVGLLMRRWDQAFDEETIESVKAEHQAGGAGAFQRSAIMEISDELGAVSEKLDRLTREVHRMGGHVEEAEAAEKIDGDDGWGHVEHLGYRIIHHDDERRRD